MNFQLLRNRIMMYTPLLIFSIIFILVTVLIPVMMLDSVLSKLPFLVFGQTVWLYCRRDPLFYLSKPEQGDKLTEKTSRFSFLSFKLSTGQKATTQKQSQPKLMFRTNKIYTLIWGKNKLTNLCVANVLRRAGQWELNLSYEKLPLVLPSQKDTGNNLSVSHKRRSEGADPVPSLPLS